MLAVGCWFGQAAIPLCHWGHSGVQPVDGSHTLSHTQTHSSVNDFLSTLNRLIHLPLDEFQAEE